jgi:hypothetical protein
MEFNASFFHEFAEAYAQRDGYRLARTLSPDIPTEKLRKIWKSQNAHDIRSALRRGLHGNAALVGGPDNQEVQGWVAVYAAYWNAVGAILMARESSDDDETQVSGHSTLHEARHRILSSALPYPLYTMFLAD